MIVEKVMEKISNTDFIKSLLQETSSQNPSSDILSKIGISIDNEYISGISILSSNYTIDGKTVGTLGIIGPNRMRYDRLIPTLSYSSTLLSDTLTQKYNVEYQEEEIVFNLNDIKLLE